VLDDGTKVVTHQGPGEKGGAGVKMREVDTIRPDGLGESLHAVQRQGRCGTADAGALLRGRVPFVHRDPVALGCQQVRVPPPRLLAPVRILPALEQHEA
ncbi:hypothetical protein EAO74_01265, partial [Streptomyces sp. gb1(2016)]